MFNDSEWWRDFQRFKSLHTSAQLVSAAIIFGTAYFLASNQSIVALTFTITVLFFTIIGGVIASLVVRRKIMGRLRRFLLINFSVIFGIAFLTLIIIQKSQLRDYSTAAEFAVFCGAISTISYCLVYPVWRRYS